MKNDSALVPRLLMSAANHGHSNVEVQRLLQLLRETIARQVYRWCGPASALSGGSIHQQHHHHLASAPPLFYYRALREATVPAADDHTSSSVRVKHPFWALSEISANNFVPHHLKSSVNNNNNHHYHDHSYRGEDWSSTNGVIAEPWWLAGGKGGEALLEAFADGSWSAWYRYASSRVFLLPLLVVAVVLAVGFVVAACAVRRWVCRRRRSRQHQAVGNDSLTTPTGTSADTESILSKEADDRVRSGQVIERRAHFRKECSVGQEKGRGTPGAQDAAAPTTSATFGGRLLVAMRRSCILILSLVALAHVGILIRSTHLFLVDSRSLVSASTTAQCSVMQTLNEVLDGDDQANWAGIDTILFGSEKVSSIIANIPQVVDEAVRKPIDAWKLAQAIVTSDLAIANSVIEALQGLPIPDYEPANCTYTSDEYGIKYATEVPTLVHEVFSWLQLMSKQLDSKIQDMLTVAFTGSDSPVRIGLMELSNGLTHVRALAAQLVHTGSARFSAALQRSSSWVAAFERFVRLYSIAVIVVTSLAIVLTIILLVLLVCDGRCWRRSKTQGSNRDTVSAWDGAEPPDGGTAKAGPVNGLDKSLHGTAATFVPIESSPQIAAARDGCSHGKASDSRVLGACGQVSKASPRLVAILTLTVWALLCSISFVGFAAFQAARFGLQDACEAVGTSFGRTARLTGATTPPTLPVPTNSVAAREAFDSPAVKESAAIAPPLQILVKSCIAPMARGNLLAEVSSRLAAMESMIKVVSNNAATTALDLINVELAQSEMESLASILRNVPLLMSHRWKYSQLASAKRIFEGMNSTSSADMPRLHSLISHSDSRWRVSPAYGDRIGIAICVQPLISKLIREGFGFFLVKSVLDYCNKGIAYRAQTIDSALRYVNEVVRACNIENLAGFCTKSLVGHEPCNVGSSEDYIILNDTPTNSTKVSFTTEKSVYKILQQLNTLEKAFQPHEAGYVQHFLNILCGVEAAATTFDTPVADLAYCSLSKNVEALLLTVPQRYVDTVVAKNVDVLQREEQKLKFKSKDCFNNLKHVLELETCSHTTQANQRGEGLLNCTSYGTIIKESQQYLDEKADALQKYADHMISLVPRVLFKASVALLTPIRDYNQLLERSDCRAVTSAFMSGPISQFCETTLTYAQRISQIFAVLTLVCFCAILVLLALSYRLMCPRRTM